VTLARALVALDRLRMDLAAQEDQARLGGPLVPCSG